MWNPFRRGEGGHAESPSVGEIYGQEKQMGRDMTHQKQMENWQQQLEGLETDLRIYKEGGSIYGAPPLDSPDSAEYIATKEREMNQLRKALGKPEITESVN